MKTSLYSVIGVCCSALALSACQTAPKTTARVHYVDMPTVFMDLDSDSDDLPDHIDECPETLPHTAVDSKGCVVVLTVGGLEMEFRGHFSPMSSQLPTLYTPELVKLVDKLNEYPKAKVVIFGHLASNEANKDALATFGFDSLSRNRALIIKNTMVLGYSVDAERIRTYDCSNKVLVVDTDNIDRNFQALTLKNIKSEQSRVTLLASSEVTDLMNLEYVSYTRKYDEYAKHCELFE